MGDHTKRSHSGCHKDNGRRLKIIRGSRLEKLRELHLKAKRGEQHE